MRTRNPSRRHAALVSLLALGAAGVALAQGPASLESSPPPEAVVPGELVIEPPTLLNLGFEWFIQGDSNRNATVDVSYRASGEATWHDALPLLRLDGERIYAESRVDVVMPNMFAGSVLDLEPDTEYEVRLVIADPDGVHGLAERTVTVRTRAEPMPYSGGRVFHVYPHGYPARRMAASSASESRVPRT